MKECLKTSMILMFLLDFFGYCQINAEALCCHNNREGINVIDVLEHIGSRDFGEALGDIYERPEVVTEIIQGSVEMIEHALGAVGNEALRSDD